MSFSNRENCFLEGSRLNDGSNKVSIFLIHQAAYWEASQHFSASWTIITLLLSPNYRQSLNHGLLISLKAS